MIALFVLGSYTIAQSDPSNGGLNCGVFDSRRGDPAYVQGFYAGWIEENASASDRSKRCSINGPYYYQNDVRQVGNQYVWTCRDRFEAVSGPGAVQCRAPILPPENPGCGGSTSYSSQPQSNFLRPLCTPAPAKGLVDPGLPTVANIRGGQGETWKRDCSGRYYTNRTCEAASQGVCNSAKNNRTFNDLSEADDLCQNGSVASFSFNEETFRWSWVCQGSSPELNATCTASKTAVLPECSPNFNNRQVNTLTQVPDLCSKGTVTNFQESPTADGRTWTCVGQPSTQTRECRASRTIQQGQCGGAAATLKVPVDVTTPAQFLARFASVQLCLAGNVTGVVMNQNTWTYKCTGSRPQDDRECTVAKNDTPGACGLAHQTTRPTLNQTTNDLCNGDIQASHFVYNSGSGIWTWRCVGLTQSAECSANRQVAGQCSTAVNARTLSYEQLLQNIGTLCTEGRPSTTSFPESSANGVWSYSCQGFHGGNNANCSVLQRADAVCSPYPRPISTRPQTLCTIGRPIGLRSLSGSRTWTCEGFNGGATLSCTAACVNGECNEAACDGLQPTVTNTQMCQDCDGCLCGGRTIFNGAVCVDTQRPVDDGAACPGPGDCLCDGLLIRPGEICSKADRQCTALTAGMVCQDRDCCICQLDTQAMSSPGTGGTGSQPSSLMVATGFQIVFGQRCEASDGRYGTCARNSQCDDVDGCVFQEMWVPYQERCGACADMTQCTRLAVDQTCTDPLGCLCNDYEIYRGMVCKQGDGTIPQINNGDRCASIAGCICDGRRVFISTLCLIRDARPTPIQSNQQCADPDGCDCNGYRIFNGGRCLVPDGIRSVLTNTHVCDDIDGCLCGTRAVSFQSQCMIMADENDPNNPNFIPAIFRHPFGPGLDSFGFGSLYDMSMMLPGNADLELTLISSVTGMNRHDPHVVYTIQYRNIGPDVAVGTYVAFRKSPLLGDLYSSIPHTMMRTSITGTAVDHRTIYMFLGNLPQGSGGTITITGIMLRSLLTNDLISTAQIQSRLRDSNPLNNTSSWTIRITDRLLDPGMNFINPLPPLRSFLDAVKARLEWIGAPTEFRDVRIGHPWYMHIMTVQRNGIMRGYQYRFSTQFEPKKCISRLEILTVAARIALLDPTNDVFRQETRQTPFRDVRGNVETMRNINRGHSIGLTDVFKAGRSNPDLLAPDKGVSHREAKEVFNRLFLRMQIDPAYLRPLFVGNDKRWSTVCVTREEAAYTVAHLLRGHPHISMGFNDIFLEKLYDALVGYGLNQRREIIHRIIIRLRLMLPSRFFMLGLDGETITGILQAALRGEQYRQQFTTSTLENFFDDIMIDEYDRFVRGMTR
ncbi:MAG: hypothetical protein NZL83_01590 [Candidatus Absconditabacterales bacterium]|nr:hypothetical protein [Candidatus Absconditabacterales bacterium]